MDVAMFRQCASQWNFLFKHCNAVILNEVFAQEKWNIIVYNISDCTDFDVCDVICNFVEWAQLISIAEFKGSHSFFNNFFCVSVNVSRKHSYHFVLQTLLDAPLSRTAEQSVLPQKVLPFSSSFMSWLIIMMLERER